ncbi:zinc finger protein 839 isoform X1 [Channa argus]|nr:hypothetical protein Q8A73_018004 [Channa argus]
MADNEDDSSSTRTITLTELPGAAVELPVTRCTQPGNSSATASAAEVTQHGKSVSAAVAKQNSQPMESSQTFPVPESSQSSESLPAGSEAQLTDFLQSGPAKQSILVGTEFTGLGPDLVNTTIIYVQPDGTLVEGSGLTAEEQQALLDQLTKQQIVQVSDTEAAQLLQQSQLVKTIPVHNTALDPNQLQQVINQVTKSQQQVQVPQQQVHVQVTQQTPKLIQVPQQGLKQQIQVQQGLKQQKQVQVPQNLKPTTQNNASQQLKSVAQQVAMQTSSSVQKSEPVRIQIQVPPKQEVKPGVAPPQKSIAVSHPQLKLSANGSMSSAQIIHIQPVVGQQGQQFFLQQSPGDPAIQLLLPSPTPVVVPLVHKHPGQASSPGTTSGQGHKPVASPMRVQTPSIVKTTPTTTTKTVSVPLIKTQANGTPSAVGNSPVKPSAVIAKVPVQSTTSAPCSMVTTPPVALPPALKDRDREREEKKKVKRKEKKAVKVQTRSGRVSRPPKYKAKDYKFIKTEDLADSHQSDSDDYSDMSVEDEEGEGGRKDASGISPSLTYSHKSRSHRCQTCDKAYIGPGGLNRHYKLNPTHGDPDPCSGQPSNTPRPLRDTSQSEETTAGGVRQGEEGKEEEEEEEEKKNDEKPAAPAPNKLEGGPAAAVGLRGLYRRGPGRPRGRGRGRGRGRPLSLPPKVTVGLVSRRGRRGRPPKVSVTTVIAEQQMERRQDRLQELVEQCEDEELMDIVLPRLTKVLSLWDLLLAKVERRAPAQTRFPDIYREFESLQAQVRQAAQDYIVSPQGTATPLEVRNIEVARSLGILDEVNKMKVVPGASPSSSQTNKNIRYMENSKMLPPSKRFKMENSVPVQQNGIESKTGGTTLTPYVCSSLKSCSVSVSPLVIPAGSSVLNTTAVSASSPSASAPTNQAPLPDIPMEVTPGEDKVETLPGGQHKVFSTSNIAVKESEKALGLDPTTEFKIPSTDQTPGSTSTPTSSSSSSIPTSASVKAPEYSTVQSVVSSGLQQKGMSQSEYTTDACEAKELQEGQEIYIQTEGLTVQLAEPGSDRIVIVNGPDGTTMHIQTPEGVPLEAVQALLGIESSDGAKVPQ